MKRLKVIVSDKFYEQLDEQVIFIAQHSVDNAIAWEGRLLTELKGLADFHGHAIDEVAHDRLGQPFRKLVFERNYLIHYVVDEVNGRVDVIGLRHGARQPRPDEP